MAAIIPYLKYDCAFEQHDITAMSMALDDICKVLNLNSDTAAREIVATRVIELAQRGERSPTRLRDRILKEAAEGAAIAIPRSPSLGLESS